MKAVKAHICFLSIVIFTGLAERVSGQFPYFAESYDILSTLAGKGEIGDKGVSGWLAEFEGGNSLEAELSRPHMAMADSAGNIYIADKDAHAIRKLTNDGKIHTIAGTNVSGFNGDGPGVECQLSSPNGLWAKADGTVFILDLGNNRIRRLDTSGQLETIVSDAKGITLGRGLWVTPAEDTIYYASGSQIKSWTKDSGIAIYASGFSGLGNITMDKNGFLVATDRTANLVYRISKDGKTREIIAGNGSGTGGGDGYPAIETGLDGVRGVWFLDDNSYFVATHEGSQIWYIDPGGMINLFLDGREGDAFHSGDGENYRTPGYKISEARSITVDYDGNVIIAENDNGYIRKVENEYTYYYTSAAKGLDLTRNMKVYPNPAGSEAFIDYSLSQPDRVEIHIFNILGEKLRTYTHDYQNKGRHRISIHTANLSDGVYYCHIMTTCKQHTIPLIISK